MNDLRKSCALLARAFLLSLLSLGCAKADPTAAPPPPGPKHFCTLQPGEELSYDFDLRAIGQSPGLYKVHVKYRPRGDDQLVLLQDLDLVYDDIADKDVLSRVTLKGIPVVASDKTLVPATDVHLMNVRTEDGCRLLLRIHDRTTKEVRLIRRDELDEGSRLTAVARTSEVWLTFNKGGQRTFLCAECLDGSVLERRTLKGDEDPVEAELRRQAK